MTGNILRRADIAASRARASKLDLAVQLLRAQKDVVLSSIEKTQDPHQADLLRAEIARIDERITEMNKQKGQGLTEYALILLLVVIVVLAAILVINPAIGHVFSIIAHPLNNQIPWWTIGQQIHT